MKVLQRHLVLIQRTLDCTNSTISSNSEWIHVALRFLHLLQDSSMHCNPHCEVSNFEEYEKFVPTWLFNFLGFVTNSIQQGLQ